MALIARTTEERERAQAKLTEIIETGKAAAARGLEALQREYQLRVDLRVRASALDVALEKTEGGFLWKPVVVDARKGKRTAFGMTGHARTQLLSRAGIPAVFVETLEKDNLPDLLRENLLQLLPRHASDGLLLRTVGDTMKAALSPSYKCIDNALIFDAFVQQALAAKLVPYRGAVSDTRGMLSFLKPEVIEVSPGEFIVVGVELRGSDYGNGADELNAMILRLRCFNGATGYDLFRKVHLGRRFDAADFGDDNVIQLSQKTIESDVRTVRYALTDVMKGMTKHLAALTESVTEAVKKDVEVEPVLASLKKRGIKASALEKVKAMYENEALPVEALPQAPGAWRLSNALSLLANSTADVDEATELRDAAFTVLPGLAKA